MSEFKGTRGKWTANKHNNVVSKHNLPIAIVYDGYTPHGSYKSECQIDRKANAKLIAAAPDMLEALKEMVSFAEFHGYTNSTEINNARLIIKKATEL